MAAMLLWKEIEVPLEISNQQEFCSWITGLCHKGWILHRDLSHLCATVTHILLSFTYKSDPTLLCKLAIPSWKLVVFLANIRTRCKWKRKKEEEEGGGEEEEEEK